MAFSLHYAITQDLKHSQRPIPEPGYSILIIFCYNPVRGFSKDSVRRTRPLPNGIDFVRTRGVQRRMRRGPVAGVAGGGRGEAFVLSPSHLSHLHCQPTPLSHKDSPPFCSALRHPVSKGWGVFSAFYPYLRTAPDPCATLFPPSKVQPLTIKLAWRTPQRRFLYGTVSRVPRVQKDAGFLYRMYPQAARVQERALFCTGRRIAPRL